MPLGCYLDETRRFGKPFGLSCECVVFLRPVTDSAFAASHHSSFLHNLRSRGSDYELGKVRQGKERPGVLKIEEQFLNAIRRRNT